MLLLPAAIDLKRRQIWVHEYKGFVPTGLDRLSSTAIVALGSLVAALRIGARRWISLHKDISVTRINRSPVFSDHPDEDF
ncbi:hypothetical protein VDGL01_04567 [Verticillium dahliae]